MDYFMEGYIYMVAVIDSQQMYHKINVSISNCITNYMFVSYRFLIARTEVASNFKSYKKLSILSILNLKKSIEKKRVSNGFENNLP